MKFKFSKILMGVSALIVAGIVSVVPFNKVQAEVLSTPVNVLAPASRGGNRPIPGNAVFTYSGIDSAQINDYSCDLLCFPGYIYEVNPLMELNSPVDPSATCNVEFSFNLNGVSYYGNVALSVNGNGFSLLNNRDISNYVDTRDLYGVQAFGRAINEKVNEIDMAFNGLNADGTVNETKTVEYNYNYAINEKIIEKLAHADGVTLLYTFEYEGYIFTSTITSEDAAKIFSKDIPWYGPCYIASNCPTVMVGVA